MAKQCWNKNHTTDDTNKVQKNVGTTQQCKNKNLTKDKKKITLVILVT